MPRIPSVSDVRSVSAAVTRDPGVRATAEDFGLAAARGLANLGIGVSNFGKGLKQYAEEPDNDEDRGDKTEDKTAEDEDSGAAQPAAAQLASNIGDTMAWDDVAASKHHIAWVREQSRLLIEKQQHQGGSPVETAGQSQKDLIAVEEERRNELPQQQRDRAKEAAKPVVTGHALSAAQRGQNLSVEASMRKMTETLELLKGQAATDPTSAEKFLADGLDLLVQSHEMGALSDAQLEQRSTAFRRDLYTQMLREQKASDVVADLEAGIYDGALDDPELTQLLLIENRWRMRGEEAQGRANGEAMVAGAAKGEGSQTGLSDDTRFLLEAGDFADFELEVEKARRVRSGVESLRFAPEDEFEAEITKLAPAVEALDKEARLDIQEAVRKGGERLLEERRADPADYAMGLPSVAKAFEAAKGDPALQPAAVSGRLAAQAAMGISPEDRRALSKAEVTEILEGYRALPVEARGGALKALQQAYGDEVGRVAVELEEAGLPFQVVQALEPGSDGALAAQAGHTEQSAASGPEGDIIAETAERLIAEGEDRSVPTPPGRKEAPPPGALRSFDDAASVAGANGVPPIPGRKLGSGLHPSEEKLLNKYQPLMEADEAILKDGLDASAVAGAEAIIEAKAAELNASSDMATLAKRLALRNLRKRGRLERSVTFALAETGIEKPNLSLDTTQYLPELTETPLDDARVHMERFGLGGLLGLRPGRTADLITKFLREDFSQIRVISKEEGIAGLDKLESKIGEITQEGQKEGLHITFGKQLFMIGEETLTTPYKQTWSLTDRELGTAMIFFARKLEASADESLLKNFLSYMLDTVPVTKLGGDALSGAKRVLDAIGIIDDLSDKDAKDALASLVSEAEYRGHISFDAGFLAGLGLSDR